MRSAATTAGLRRGRTGAGGVGALAPPRLHRLVVREVAHALCRDLGLRAADVVRSEEELAVEIGIVDGVEVDHGDEGEAGEHQILHQLATDPARANDEHLRTRAHAWRP